MIELKLTTLHNGYTEVYCQKCFLFVGRGNFRDVISNHLEEKHSFT